MIWEVKYARFYRKRPDGLPGPAGCLIVARDVLAPDTMKFFVANLWPGSRAVTLTWLLWVAFSRWPIERCFQQAKDELGMDHFEVRGWRSIHRHLYITQLSHLFCARTHQNLREKNDRRPLPDRRTGTARGLRLGPDSGPAAVHPIEGLPANGRADRLLPAPQSTGPRVAHQENAQTNPRHRHLHRTITLLRTG